MNCNRERNSVCSVICLRLYTTQNAQVRYVIFKLNDWLLPQFLLYNPYLPLIYTMWSIPLSSVKVKIVTKDTFSFISFHFTEFFNIVLFFHWLRKTFDLEPNISLWEYAITIRLKHIANNYHLFVAHMTINEKKTKSQLNGHSY